MKIRRLIPKQKLRATARRVPQRAMDDFGQEPSISFGKALIVFIVLHVVAVSGIYIFNSLKARNIEQSSSTGTPRVSRQSTPAPADPRPLTVQHDSQNIKPVAKVLPKPTVEAVKPVDTTHRSIAEEPFKTPARETPAASAAKDSGQIYTVVKGDNPVVIAKKLHVNYDELVKINKIEDPKKLRIGQKLRVPAKSKK